MIVFLVRRHKSTVIIKPIYDHVAPLAQLPAERILIELKVYGPVQPQLPIERIQMKKNDVYGYISTDSAESDEYEDVTPP